MHNPIHLLSDYALGITLNSVSVATALLGAILSVTPIKNLSWKVLSIFGFVILGVSSLLLNGEQSLRSTSQQTQLAMAQVSFDGKLSGALQVLHKLEGRGEPLGLQSAIEKINSLKDPVKSQKSFPPTLSPTREELVLVRAEHMKKLLCGFRQQWDTEINNMEARVKQDQVVIPSTYTAQQRQLVREADQREIKERMKDIDKQDAAYYNNNYRSGAEELRAEMTPFVPGATDLTVDYENPTITPEMDVVCRDFSEVLEAFRKVHTLSTSK